ELLARPHPGLTRERGPEVEEQGHLSEQPALAGELHHLVLVEPLAELGDLARPHAALLQRAPRRPPRQERVAAEREDHASVTTADRSASSAAAVACRAAGSRDSARFSTTSNGRASSGRALSGTLSSPAR